MSKDKISDYSATANSNTDIGGINIDEGCAPSGINDAIRTLMKQLKDWQSGSQDVYIHPAGSASVPSITATGDTNTGLFFPAADTVGISTGGTERARVDSSGNLGLGVTPSAWDTTNGKAIQLPAGSIWNYTTIQMNLGFNYFWNGTNYKYKNNGYASSFDQSGGVFYWQQAASGTAGNNATFTQAMTLDASGRLGLGVTPTGSWSMQIYGVGSASSGAARIRLQNSATGATDSDGGSISMEGVDMVLQNSENGVCKWEINGSERARITSSGQVFVNTTSSLNGTLDNFQLYPVTSGSSQYGMMIGGNAQSYTVYAMRFLNTWTPAVVGSITIGTTSTAYNTSSDYRLKHDIAPMTGALAKVAALKPVTYKWNADDSDGEGFIAHELAEVVPQAVVGEKDAVDEDGNPVYQGIDTSFLVATLTAAIQEQQAIITQLQADVSALKGQA